MTENPHKLALEQFTRTILARMLLDPTDRMQDFREIYSDLCNICAHHGVSADDVFPLTKDSRWGLYDLLEQHINDMGRIQPERVLSILYRSIHSIETAKGLRSDSPPSTPTGDPWRTAGTGPRLELGASGEDDDDGEDG